MTTTGTPTEPTTPRRRNVALIVIGVVVLAIVAGIALLMVLGVFLLTPVDTDSGPIVESTVQTGVVPDGEMFVFVTEVGEDSLTVDPAAMLTGEEARAAAEADGVIGPGEDLPNDFYIDNPEPDTLTMGVADDAPVTVLTFDSGGAITENDIALSDLAVAFTGDYPGTAIYGLAAGEFPMTVTVEEGTVVDMTQVYLP